MVRSKKSYTKIIVSFFTLTIIALLTIFLAFVVGCSSADPKADEAEGAKTEEVKNGADEGIPFDWDAQSECETCHVREAECLSDAKCLQAIAHSDVGCMECHTEEALLSDAHEGLLLSDKPGKSAKLQTVPEQGCIDCHGTIEEMEALTAGSTALTDSNGTSVNPHEQLPGEKHEANRPTCVDCHNNHSEDLSKDAMKFCAQCHHRGISTCRNCHSID